MDVVSHEKISTRAKRLIRLAIAAVLLIALAAGIWGWLAQSTAAIAKGTGAVQVVSALVTRADISVRLTANGTVSALQAVEVRPQISATVKAVHIKEGQFVRKGERLFTLDARSEDANLSKARAQVTKDRADLANAARNLERLRGLLKQEYISQAEFDAAQNQVDVFRGQLEVDLASEEASRVARSFNEIAAPIGGRTGAIAVYPGSLVQPSGAALVSITQIDPINVSFALPERELASLQQSMVKGAVPVSAMPDVSGQEALKGHITFVDNAVDTASGTIRLKAEFSNAEHRLWPGMFVTVALAPSMLSGALTVPVQAVQTGPEKKFLYVIGADNKVASVPITVRLIQDGVAVVDGIALGARVVVEGAQNIRPGSIVAESGKVEKSEANHGKNTGKDGAKANSAGKQ